MAQLRLKASLNWAKLLTCKTADLTREGQPRGSGISGDDDLTGVARLQEALPKQFLEAYHKLLCFPELRPTRKEPKLAGLAHWLSARLSISSVDHDVPAAKVYLQTTTDLLAGKRCDS